MKNEKILVSIIVPIYNVEKYLRECLDSIINQSYKNLELLLIDDGSQDSSSIIADEYAMRDTRVTVVHKENEGQPATKNHGIRLATGKFITFVDADDYIREDYIENLADDMIKHNVVVTTSTKTYPIGKHGSNNIIVYKQEKAFEKLFYGTLEHSENGVQMFDRKFLLDNSIFSNPEKKIGEDFDFLAQALNHCDRIAVDNRKMYCYRPNPTSMMNQKINADIMKSIDTFSDIGTALMNKYPHMNKAVEAKKFNDSVALSVRGYEEREDWEESYMKLWSNISSLKWKVLFDKKARIKVRLAALIYCVFGNHLGTATIKGMK